MRNRHTQSVRDLEEKNQIIKQKDQEIADLKALITNSSRFSQDSDLVDDFQYNLGANETQEVYDDPLR